MGTRQMVTNSVSNQLRPKKVGSSSRQWITRLLLGRAAAGPGVRMLPAPSAPPHPVLRLSSFCLSSFLSYSNFLPPLCGKQNYS